MCIYAYYSLIVGLIPENVRAEGSIQAISNEVSDIDISDTENSTTNEEIQLAPKVLYELEDEREENVKHFLMSNHTVQAVMYSEPIHYKEDGKWKDIDNTLSLEEASNQEDFKGYTNAQADFSVKIAADSKDNLVKIEKEKYSLEFKLVNDQ